MKMRHLWLLAGFTAAGSTACGPTTQEAPLTGTVQTRQQALSAANNGPLPRGLTEDELALTETDPSQGAAKAYAWQCDAATFGFTSSPLSGVRLPAEHDSSTGLLIGWPQYGCTVPELTDLVRVGVEQTQVTLVVPQEHQQGAVACLQHKGLSDAQIARIEFVNAPINSVWIRDYGPEVVQDAQGQRQLVDMSYYPQLSDTCNKLAGRVGDDSSPTVLAAAWGMPVHRSQVRLEGGNLQTDGKGTCFRSRRNPNARNNFSQWQYTEEELNSVIGAAHGCKVYALESMVGGVIDHIDMYMTVISDDTILVGRYDVADDAANAAILDRNAAFLSGLGYRVVRVPMPKPYCRTAAATCTGMEALITSCDQPSTERIWATYMNSIRIGNAMAVPEYKWVPESHKAIIAAQQAEAYAIYQRELDREFGAGTVKVEPIHSDSLIPCQGSLHCVTMTYQ